MAINDKVRNLTAAGKKIYNFGIGQLVIFITVTLAILVYYGRI